MNTIKHVVFDLGNVLIGWDPHALYRQRFPDDAERTWFFEHVCTDAWNLALDKGGAFDDAIAQKQIEFPQFHSEIGWWKSRWSEMILGEMPGTVAILQALHEKGTSLFALSNWSAETFPYARKHFTSLQLFKDIILSGAVKHVKPEREIYDLAVTTWSVKPGETLFIDDSAKNVAGAIAAGWNAIQFTSAERLREDLRLREVL